MGVTAILLSLAVVACTAAPPSVPPTGGSTPKTRIPPAPASGSTPNQTTCGATSGGTSSSDFSDSIGSASSDLVGAGFNTAGIVRMGQGLTGTIPPGRGSAGPPNDTPRGNGPPGNGTPGGGPPAPPRALTASEAVDRAMEAANHSRKDQIASGADRPLPVAITSIDESGRPQIRQVSGADYNTTAAAAVSTVEQSLLAGESVINVEADQIVTSDDLSEPRAAWFNPLALLDPATRTSIVNSPSTEATLTEEAATDPGRKNQWALDQFRFEDASQAVSGEENLLVSVVDSGIDVDHPDLAGVVVASHNFTQEALTTPGAHGTHVAGIIAAVAQNGMGGRGATPDVRLMNAKALDSTGSGYMSDAADAVIWSVDNGASVVNLSLAGDRSSTAMDAALAYAEDSGTVVVAAAGNDGVAQKRDGAAAGQLYSWPAADPRTIAVAALDESGSVSGFSTCAPYVDVAAPGGLIYSTYPANRYVYMSGTSMATPYVSSLAVLTMATEPTATASQIRSRITSQATDIGAPGRDGSSGWGKVNLASLTH
ncbi:MAG: S8 family serine peptidase [Microthrixaceae bacterium]